MEYIILDLHCDDNYLVFEPNINGCLLQKIFSGK